MSSRFLVHPPLATGRMADERTRRYRHARHAAIETLEPRRLLSSDYVYGHLDDTEHYYSASGVSAQWSGLGGSTFTTNLTTNQVSVTLSGLPKHNQLVVGFIISSSLAGWPELGQGGEVSLTAGNDIIAYSPMANGGVFYDEGYLLPHINDTLTLTFRAYGFSSTAGGSWNVTNVNIWADRPEVSIGNPSGGDEDLVSPNGGAKPVKYRLTRGGGDRNAALPVKVDFLPDAVAKAEDFTNWTDGSYTIPAGQDFLDIELTPKRDGLLEGTEATGLSISSDPNGVYLISNGSNQATTNVADADFAFSEVAINFASQGIKRDTGDQAPYADLEFFDKNADGSIGTDDVASPASFVRNTDLEFSVNLKFKEHVFRPGEYSLAATVEGFSSNGAREFGRAALSLSPDGQFLSGSFQNENKLKDLIDIAEQAKIKFIVYRKSNNAEQASKEYNCTAPKQGDKPMRFYVTAAAAPNAFETVLHLGCDGAKGLAPGGLNQDRGARQAADRAVVNGIWGKFSNNQTQRVDGTTMRYTHILDFGISYEEMLKNPNGLGQCTAWAGLLTACGNVAGVSSRSRSMRNPNLLNPEYRLNFVVKPIPAQGTGGANYGVREFGFHMVIKFDCYPTSIFDPSYGGTPIHASGNNSAEVMYERANLQGVQYLDPLNPTQILEKEDDPNVVDLDWY